MNREQVRDGVEQLRARGKVYLTSHDVADVLDIDATTGKKGHISRLLSDIEIVEKWGRSKNITWRVTEES